MSDTTVDNVREFLLKTLTIENQEISRLFISDSMYDVDCKINSSLDDFDIGFSGTRDFLFHCPAKIGNEVSEIVNALAEIYNSSARFDDLSVIKQNLIICMLGNNK